jgi:hypothetical protein
MENDTQQLFHRLIREKPHKLIDALEDVIEGYHLSKECRSTFPTKAEERLEDGINKLFFLKRIPKSSLPISGRNYETWINSLERISISCQQMLTELRGSRTPRTTRIGGEWAWETLQEQVHLDVLERCFVPLVDEGAPVLYDTLVLKGGRNVGKTFFIHRVREYVMGRGTNIFWSEWKESFMDDVDAFRIYKWKVFVFDLDFMVDTVDVERYRMFTNKVEGVLTVVLTATPTQVPPLGQGRNSCYVAELRPPSEASIFQFMKAFFVPVGDIENVPLLRDSAGMFTLAKTMNTEEMSYDDVTVVLNNAEYLTRENELFGGSVWKKGDIYYTKNAVRPREYHLCEYQVVRAVERDVVVFGEERYVNTKLMDNFPYMANDCFSNIFVTAASTAASTGAGVGAAKPVLDIICQLDVNVCERSRLSSYEYLLTDYVLKYWLTLAELFDGKQPRMEDMRTSYVVHNAKHIFAHYSLPKLRRRHEDLPTGQCIVYVDVSGHPYRAILGSASAEIPRGIMAEDLCARLLEGLGVHCQVIHVSVSDAIQSYIIDGVGMTTGKQLEFTGNGVHCNHLWT